MILESKKLKSVLLIDDDETVNYLNSIIINHSGLVDKIKTVKSALSGLKELDLNISLETWPSIIFVDINMPAVNGWEFIDQFRDKFDEYKNKCIVCMLSSSLDPKDQQKADNSDMVDFFISKPLTVESVSDLYQKYFDKNP